MIDIASRDEAMIVSGDQFQIAVVVGISTRRDGSVPTAGPFRHHSGGEMVLDNTSATPGKSDRL